MADDSVQSPTFANVRPLSGIPTPAPAATVPPPQGASFTNVRPISSAPVETGPENSDAAPQQQSVPQQPSVMDHVKTIAQHVIDTTPVVGDIHRAAETVQNWANKKMSPENPQMQGPLATLGTGIARDAAGAVAGVTSPEGLGMTAAGIAAPEVVGPALAAHGIHSIIQGWGDLRNPDTLQHELNAAAEIASGAGMTGETLRTGGGPITQQIRQNTARQSLNKAPSQQLEDFKRAVPPSKSAPYTDVDYHAARPYLEIEHTTGVPINSPVGLRDAADSAVEKIEGRIAGEIQNNPNEVIGTNPIAAAKSALSGSVRTDFYEAGMRELENYPLGFQRAGGQVDPPLTLQRADDIRWQINQDNKAILARNNYDRATALATDPGFAAREAVSEALRNGVYDKLEQLGFREARALRRDEGSLLKIRNASLKQEFNGEKTGRQPEVSVPRKIAANVAKKAAIGGGAAIGAHVAGVPGAVTGAEIGSSVGDMAAKAILPGPETKNALLDRSFRPTPVVPSVQNAPASAAAPATGISAGENDNRIVFKASDGTMHSIPKNENAIAHARVIDPNLTIIE